MKKNRVYDSAFGNTEKIAQSMGSAHGVPPDVIVMRVGGIDPGELTGNELLIVGSPT